MIDQNKERFDRYLKRRQKQLGSAIHEIWESRDETVWSKDPYFFLRLGELADTHGQAMFAHDVLREGLRFFPDHLRLIQKYSLSLITCGFLLTARNLLTNLMKQGHYDEETLGILGRVYKEMWLAEGQGVPGHAHLEHACKLYRSAFRRSRGPYSGINAASLSLIMGDKPLSERLARQVIRLCTERWKQPDQRDYWTMATLAEAFLILGRQGQAAKYYRIARAMSGKSFSNLASTRRQLMLLGRHTAVDPQVLDILRIPPVVAFSGHMLDSPSQKRPHFPPSQAAVVKEQIAKLLEKLDVRIGYGSAACGSDVLFHECLQERGGESNIVLPFDQDEFFETSVDFAGREWTQRTQGILAKSSSVERATHGGYLGDDLLFSYANGLIVGKAILRSRFLETEPLLIAVWDGVRRGKPGGTSECVQMWERAGYPYTVIDPKTAAVVEHAPPRARRRSAGTRAPRRAGAPAAGTARRETVSILFADMVGYSLLREEQIPQFVQGFLQKVAETVKRSRVKPLYQNTWGDAICFVYANPIDAAEGAMAMRDMVRATDWARWNLPKELNVRIGLHAGPVYCVREPLLDRTNFFGFHVNQAARIEPITNPGNVYASESFASLLLADRDDSFDCRYVGIVVLPKKFGSYPIYHIKRKAEVG
jgi:class 3 adenylate cyclase